MQIGICYEDKIQGIFSFCPFCEMAAALHVAANPVHHFNRSVWAENLSARIGTGLLKEIRSLSDLTNEWLVIADFEQDTAVREQDIPNTLLYLEGLSPARWNALFQSYGKKITVSQRKRILAALRSFYELFFCKEIALLQPLIIRILTQDLEKCRGMGLFPYLNTLHERLHAQESEIQFVKSKVHVFKKSEIRQIYISASTFYSPHLMLGEAPGTLYVYRAVLVENRAQQVPSDLMAILKAVGDENRVRIIRAVSNRPACTQSLAAELGMSEAGVSKHLKLLTEAGIVEKSRSGKYVQYSLCPDAIDSIPYRMCEYLI